MDFDFREIAIRTSRKGECNVVVSIRTELRKERTMLKRQRSCGRALFAGKPNSDGEKIIEKQKE